MQNLWQVQSSYLIPLLPLLGAAIAGFFGARWLKGNSHWPIWLGVGASALISLSLLFGMLRLWPKEAEHKTAPGNTEMTARAEPGSIPPPKVEHSRFPLSYSQDWYTWIQAGAFKATAGFFFDPLTAVMLCVVCGIGFLITIFAAGYMKGEAGYFRFFAYLGLFIFAMTI